MHRLGFQFSLSLSLCRCVPSCPVYHILCLFVESDLDEAKRRPAGSAFHFLLFLSSMQIVVLVVSPLMLVLKSKIPNTCRSDA